MWERKQASKELANSLVASLYGLDYESLKNHNFVLARTQEDVPPEVPFIMMDVLREVQRQNKLWGQQNHENGTGMPWMQNLAATAREHCNIAFANGLGTWRHILYEEVMEAFAESDPVKLREELIQADAVIISWVSALDRAQERTARDDEWLLAN